jgi:hypothetical protein
MTAVREWALYDRASKRLARYETRDAMVHQCALAFGVPSRALRVCIEAKEVAAMRDGERAVAFTTDELNRFAVRYAEEHPHARS